MRKIVVITGAGAGVGRAAATEFARNGCDVALLSRASPDWNARRLNWNDWVRVRLRSQPMWRTPKP